MFYCKKSNYIYVFVQRLRHGFWSFLCFFFLFFVINILTYGENTNLKRFLYINTNFSM